MGPVFLSSKLHEDKDLVSGQKSEAARRVGDHISLGAGIETGGGVPEPVQTNTQHTKVLETGDKQFLIRAPITQLLTWTIKYWHLAHPASVSVVQSSGCGVAWQLIIHKLSQKLGHNGGNQNLVELSLYCQATSDNTDKDNDK